MRFAALIAFALAVLAGVASAKAGGCETVKDVPCLSVPLCKKGAADIPRFWENTAPATAIRPQNDAWGSICHDDGGIIIKLTAQGPYMESAWSKCTDEVWTKDSVTLETFITPVATLKQNPRYYWELDATPTGVLWTSLIENPAEGLDNNCPVCEGGAGHLDCSGAASYSRFPDLQLNVTTEARAVVPQWSTELYIPFAMFPCAIRSTPYYRANFYRYDYPEGAKRPYELSAWQPTHSGTFHDPRKFGALYMEDF